MLTSSIKEFRLQCSSLCSILSAILTVSGCVFGFISSISSLRKAVCLSQNHIFAYLIFIFLDSSPHGKGVMIMFRTVIGSSERIFSAKVSILIKFLFSSVTSRLSNALKVGIVSTGFSSISRSEVSLVDNLRVPCLYF